MRKPFFGSCPSEKHDRALALAFGLALTLMTISSLKKAVALPTVPEGFTIHPIANVVMPPVSTNQPNYLQDIAPSPGGSFGDYVYFIVCRDYSSGVQCSEIWRVHTLEGSAPTLFSMIPGGLLSNLTFGFEGDLFAVDGQQYVPSKVYRIRQDGRWSLFNVPIPLPTTQNSEGATFSSGGLYGNHLFVSEFDNCLHGGNPIYTIDAMGVRTEFARLTSVGCRRLSGLAFGPGGKFGNDLFAIYTNTGDIYRVAPDGNYEKFSVTPEIGRAETLAFGSSANGFDGDLFVARDYSGDLLRITPNGKSSVFASGFDGFEAGGVTGLKFNMEKTMLFVTDDVAGTIYKIGESSSLIRFDAFRPRIEFTLGPRSSDDSYKARGWFKLADASNGIDPLNEPVSIEYGSFSHTIPAGSFVQDGASYFYKGPVGAASLDVRITPKPTPGYYWLNSCLRHADLSATTLKPEVQLTIGDDSGKATLDVGYAKFGKGAAGQKWVFPPAN